MRAEVIIPIDRPTELIQGIFNHPELVKRLVGGRNKHILTEKAAQINAFDPQEKVIFLEKTFAILSNPDPLSQNQRDAGLDLLNVTDLADVDREKLKKSYLKAVYNLHKDLNRDSDPYGEIHALLEAGKIIAPFLENSRGVAISWNRVAKAFTGDDCQKILDDIKEIRLLIPKTFSEFDTNVAMHMKDGLRNQEIAEKLGVAPIEINRSISRLKNKDRDMKKFPRKRSRQ